MSDYYKIKAVSHDYRRRLHSLCFPTGDSVESRAEV